MHALRPLRLIVALLVSLLVTPAGGQTPAPALLDDPAIKDIAIDREVTLKISNLKAWLENKPSEPGKPAQPRKLEDLRIWIDGVLMPELAPLDPTITEEGGVSELRFLLRRHSDSQASKTAWATLLSRQIAREEQAESDPSAKNSTNGTVRISVGPESGPFESKQRARIRILEKHVWIWYWIGSIGSLILLVVIACCTDLIRNNGVPRVGGSSKRNTFSLSKLQMALWFFAVTHGFIFICLANRGADVAIPATILGLMGISMATGFGAVVMDTTKRDEAQVKLAELATLQAGTSLTPEQNARTQILTNKKAELEAQVYANPSENIVKDLLHDGHTISLHRLQILVWTIVVLGIFIQAVYHTVNFPNLSETLLGLMGISSGAYLGFKMPEKQ